MYIANVDIMKFIGVIIIFLSSFCSAQQKYKAKQDPEAPANIFWYLVERHKLPSIYATNVLFPNSDIEPGSWRLVRGEDGKKVFGSKGKKVGVIFKLKPNTELVSIDELLKLYKVKERKLPVLIDGLDCHFPDHLYAVKSSIQFVKISEHPRTRDKVVYIRTFRPLPNPKDY